MNAIKQWYGNHTITAHTVASAWVFLTGLWYFSPPFHDYVVGIYNGLPKNLHSLIAGVVVPALIYWRTQKKTTVTAEVAPGETGAAEAIATANPPKE